MTLHEKFENVALVHDKALNLVKNNVQVADEYAIGFGEWVNGIDIYDRGLSKHISIKELLEIYKKEKGL